MPTSLNTCQSSHLASTSSCIESPSPPRALSGEPLLFEMHQSSSPRCRVALAVIPPHLTDDRHRNPAAHRRPCSGRRPTLFLHGPRQCRIRCGPRTIAGAGSLALFCFSKISDLVQIIANFKNLHMIHLTSENYETNFVG
jgi:hypothetical protein